MKKILVLTDFSVPAENAAKYAVALAAVSHADVWVANAFLVPSDTPLAATIAWPLIDYDSLKNESESQLDRFIQKLSNKVHANDIGNFQPLINFETHAGAVFEVATLLVAERKIDLVVMGMSGAGPLTQLILGSSCRTMIEQASFPVLYIPYDTSFKPIKTIAFATDLNIEDIMALKAIIQLLDPVHLNIKIIHITEKEIKSLSKRQHLIDQFLDEVRDKIKHLNIDFEYVWNIDVDSGLEWLSEQNDADILVMVHHNHSFLQRLFNGSHTHKISRNSRMPLLVFPAK